jgi:hypothetical protein
MPQQDRIFCVNLELQTLIGTIYRFGVDSKNRKKSHACVALTQALLSFEWKQQKRASSDLSNNGQILGL